MDDLLDGLVDPPYERLVFARCAIVPLARVHGTTPVIRIGVEQSLASGVSAPTVAIGTQRAIKLQAVRQSRRIHRC